MRKTLSDIGSVQWDATTEPIPVSGLDRIQSQLWCIDTDPIAKQYQKSAWLEELSFFLESHRLLLGMLDRGLRKNILKYYIKPNLYCFLNKIPNFLIKNQDPDSTKAWINPNPMNTYEFESLLPILFEGLKLTGKVSCGRYVHNPYRNGSTVYAVS
jgi:hypothetical protein